MSFGDYYAVKESADDTYQSSYHKQNECVVDDIVFLQQPYTHPGKCKGRGDGDINSRRKHDTEHSKRHKEGKSVVQEYLSDICK